VEVVEIMTEEKQARFKTTCLNQEGAKVLDGEAVVSPPRPPKK
jgi:3-hydroxybutyryl-CoA dehydratase